MTCPHSYNDRGTDAAALPADHCSICLRLALEEEQRLSALKCRSLADVVDGHKAEIAALCREKRELRAEVEALREAIAEAEHLLAMDRTTPHTNESFKAVDINLALRVLRAALARKES
jgi:hypothetical protein